MGLVKTVSIHPLESIQGGMAQFYTPQSCNETMLVQIPGGTIDDLFVHRYQTDQIMVVRGSFVLVILSDRQYKYINLSEHQSQVVTIPPGVPHGAINLKDEPCFLVNAVIRHGIALLKDYQPLKRPFPYNLSQAQAEDVTLNSCSLVA
ncbi:dTDP-4-dehydrorhamnose 3,5-epimerase [Aphanothece hegewaldii CCALA 016]|uniref:dTDP-4-dehydrorhamnose 3,5-epimerase n=1 Tax=Aphanothece hegewaldii CCALA 016 TaxID=2107694 RepID=A0A2T1LW71_9CHRO|nr:cupin domain-containing protein [Aphanothece hegewaldii]PSF36136.1 dTDP-4-dehydrorhamnose 3,5-epimerase [Aphanothece hegewaldii CCALA 016]